MEKLTFDTGIQSFRVSGGGVLRFNPADPNVYARFLEAAEEIKAMELQLQEQSDALAAIGALDKKLKALLGGVFPGNDFDALLGGVNLLAVASNGQLVVTNLLDALQPVLMKGAKLCAQNIAREAQ